MLIIAAAVSQSKGLAVPRRTHQVEQTKGDEHPMPLQVHLLPLLNDLHSQRQTAATPQSVASQHLPHPQTQHCSHSQAFVQQFYETCMPHLLSEKIGSAGLHHGCDHAGAKWIPLGHLIVSSTSGDYRVLDCVESSLQSPERHQDRRSEQSAAVPGPMPAS
jgi:hypothetical protein